MNMCLIFVVACLALLGSYDTSAARIKRLGNPIQASASGVDVAGATFLLNDILLTDGVLFAYSAYFRTNTQVRLQLWRPHQLSGFKLVSETKVIPSVVEAREDVYIASRLTDKCVRVKAGDRLGVFLEDAPGAVSYTFDAESPTVFGRTLKNLSEPVQVGDIVSFDPLTFPYKFSVSAHIDTDLTQYENDTSDEPECPKGMLIPDYDAVTMRPTSTVLPPTGKPGATGATGPSGEVGATGARGMNGTDGVIGATGATGVMGATGDTGSQGAGGATGATGPEGSVGATGAKGEKGDRGEKGTRGPAGIPGSVVYANRTSETADDPEAVVLISGMSMSLIILILLIWLGVVTLSLLIVIICLVFCRRKRSSKYSKDGTSSTSPLDKECGKGGDEIYPDPPQEWLEPSLNQDKPTALGSSENLAEQNEQTPRLEFMYENEVSLADEIDASMSIPSQEDADRSELVNY